MNGKISKSYTSRLIFSTTKTSVIHEPLRKRYDLLKGAIRGCLNKGAVKVGDTGITCAVVSPFQDDIADNESQAEIARKFRTVVEQNDPNAIAKD